MRKLLTFLHAPPYVINYLSPYTFDNYKDALIDNNLELI